jgi:hypothetical protein
MVFQVGYCIMNYLGMRGIENGILAWVHGDPQVPLFYLISYTGQSFSELFLPGKIHLLMRSKRNDIGTYSKKMDLFLPVIIYHAFQG